MLLIRFTFGEMAVKTSAVQCFFDGGWIEGTHVLVRPLATRRAHEDNNEDNRIVLLGLQLLSELLGESHGTHGIKLFFFWR